MVKRFACVITDGDLLCLFLGATKGEALKPVAHEPDNKTDVEGCVKKAKANEKEFTKININNIREIQSEVIQELLNALKENTTVEVLEMSNVGMTDTHGRVGKTTLDRIPFHPSRIDSGRTDCNE